MLTAQIGEIGKVCREPLGTKADKSHFPENLVMGDAKEGDFIPACPPLRQEGNRYTCWDGLFDGLNAL